MQQAIKLNSSTTEEVKLPKRQEKKDPKVIKTKRCAKPVLVPQDRRSKRQSTLRRHKGFKKIDPKEQIKFFDDKQFKTPLPKTPPIGGTQIAPLRKLKTQNPVFASAPAFGAIKPKLPTDESIFREIYHKELAFLQSISFLTRKGFKEGKTIVEYLYAHKIIDEAAYRVLRDKEIVLREMEACVKEFIKNLKPDSDIPYKSQLLFAFDPLNFQAYIDAIHHYIRLHQQDENLFKKITSSSNNAKFQAIEKEFRTFTGDQNNLDSQFIKPVQHLPRFTLHIKRFCENLKQGDLKKFAPILKKIGRELSLVGTSNNRLKESVVKFKLKIGEGAFDSIIEDEQALQILHNHEPTTPIQHALKYLISKLRVQSQGAQEDLLVIQMYESPQGIKLLTTAHLQSSPRKGGDDSKTFDESALLPIAKESLLRSIVNYQKKFGCLKIDASNLEEVMKCPKQNRQFELFMVFTRQERYLRAYYELVDLMRMAKNPQRSHSKLEMFIITYLEDTSPMRLDYLQLDSQKLCTDAQFILRGLAAGYEETVVPLTTFIEKMQKALLEYLRKRVEGKLISRTKKSNSF